MKHNDELGTDKPTRDQFFAELAARLVSNGILSTDVSPSGQLMTDVGYNCPSCNLGWTIYRREGIGQTAVYDSFPPSNQDTTE